MHAIANGGSVDTVTFGDLLDRASAFEERVAHYYASIRDSSAGNEVRLLTYYLARHRRHQKHGLADLDADQKERFRAIEMEHDIRFVPEKSFAFSMRPLRI